MPAQKIYSDEVLDCVEGFLDTNPLIDEAGLDVKFVGNRETGENESVRMQHLFIGEDLYLVVVKKVGA